MSFFGANCMFLAVLKKRFDVQRGFWGEILRLIAGNCCKSLIFGCGERMAGSLMGKGIGGTGHYYSLSNFHRL